LRRTGGLRCREFALHIKRRAHSTHASSICGHFRVKLKLMATANIVHGRPSEAAHRSERAQELDEVVLLLAGQFRAEHQVEELDRIVECQKAPVVQVRR